MIASTILVSMRLARRATLIGLTEGCGVSFSWVLLMERLLFLIERLRKKLEETTSLQEQWVLGVLLAAERIKYREAEAKARNADAQPLYCVETGVPA